jgi:hypothetical protein
MYQSLASLMGKTVRRQGVGVCDFDPANWLFRELIELHAVTSLTDTI